MGTFRCVLSSRDFRDWIQDLGVVDWPLHDIKFTWRRNGSMSRLDRVLCCNNWLRQFPNLVLRGEKRHLSDHNPLVLLLDDRTDWGPKPFRCFDAWFFNPSFKKFIVSEWRGLPQMSIMNKMKAIKGPLRTWSKDHFGQMEKKISELEVAIHEVDCLGESRPLTDIEQARLQAAQCLLQSWLIRKESIWRQKARSLGLNLKDRNTKFYHSTTIFRRKKKFIVSLRIDNRDISGIHALKGAVRDHFAQKFS